MRIDRIRLINFRAFEDVSLDLDPRLTLLVGRNASGKSTLLDGLAVALGAWLSGFAGIREDHPIAKSTARLVRREHDGIATVDAAYPVRVEAVAEVFGANVEWARELRSIEGRTTTGDASQVRNLAMHAEETLASADPPRVLPVVAYYGTGRLWVQKRDVRGDRRSLTSRLAGYRAALEAASDHKGFEAWLAWREEDRLQRLARADESGKPLADVLSPDIDAVSRAASSCLEGATRIFYSVHHQELRVELANGLPQIPFDALSDGQRNLIAVAADIAWRAIQLNPHLGADAPSETPGVVLIDEIDLHLHPAWQQRVLADLQGAFPKMQFIASTHSPQVMASASSNAVRLIDIDHSIRRVRRVAGKDANTILEDVFGVSARPKEYKSQLEELARLIDDGHLVEGRTLLATLAGTLGDDDAAIVAARWELEIQERSDEAS